MKFLNFTLCGRKYVLNSGLFFTFFFLLFSTASFAQRTFFVDAVNGNDNNAGMSEGAAWRTLSKVSSSGFGNGDVISLRRGQVHYGRLVVNASGLTFNAYGNGANPVVSGARELSGWTNAGGGVFETSLTGAPRVVMIDGRKYGEGRYPDAGWLNIDATTGGSISSSGLGGRNFTGGKAVIRKNRWIIDKDSINSQSGNTINFNYRFYAAERNYKFFVTDHISTLSVYGEWFYDHAARKLKVYTGASAPGSVVASNEDNVVMIRNVDNVAFQDIVFTMANGELAYLSNTNNIRFRGCRFEYAYNGIGFWSGGNTNNSIINCTFRYINNNGVYVAESGNNSGFVLEGNDFHQIGATPGEGGNGDGTYTAINMGGGFFELGPTSNARVSKNRIDTVGYVAIMGGGENLLVSDNLINYYCTIKDDGGAIYDSGPGTNKRITGNIILNGAIDAWQGSADRNTFAYGIYMDNDAVDFDIDNNSIANGVVGIFLHDSRNIRVNNNHIFNMKDKSIMVWKSGLGRSPVSGISLQQNIAVNLDRSSRLLDVQNLANDGTNIAGWGSIDNNYYCRPMDEGKIIYSGYSSGSMYTLNEWRNLHGFDRNSRQSPKTFPGNINPSDSIIFVYNPTSGASAVALNGTYVDARGISYSGSITLQPYRSAILFVNSAVTSMPNTPPAANAGADQSVVLPANSVTLNGSGTDADGTIISYRWDKISGPNSGVISNAMVAVTVITGLAAGVYIYRLTVTDNRGVASFDDVQITVQDAAPAPPANQVPVVNAGNDIVIALPVSTATLNGTATDADGSIASTAWTKVSGPAGGNIQSPAALITGISGLIAGTYVFRLTVTDNGGATASDDVQVIVNTSLAPSPSNQAPTADAGPDQTITLPTNTVTLNGTGNDPDGSITGYNWARISGPNGSGLVQQANSASTQVTGLTAGTFVYRLTVTDNAGATASSDVTVTVNPESVGSNRSPIANAGHDFSVTLPTNAANLNGSASSDPDGTIASYQWRKVQGPNSGSFNNANVMSPVFSGMARGTYEFELTVTDNRGAVSTDRVSVSVLKINQKPVVQSRDTILVSLPVRNTELSAVDSYDPDGAITAYKWSFRKGPQEPKMYSPDNKKTVVADLMQGTYEFGLEVTDDDGEKSSKSVTVIVKNGTGRKLIPDVKLYPNPATSLVNVEIDTEVDGRTTLTFYDMNGRPVMTDVFNKSYNATTRTVNIARLPKGAYTILIQVDQTQQVVEKLVKY
jgi:parallel beta-helix repeat protein